MTPDTVRSDAMDDRVVVVTGGVSGIGRATTEAFAKRGATVVAGYHSDRSAATALCDDLAASPGTVAVRQFDVRDFDAVEDAFAAIADAHGEITTLVNNAGVLTHSLLLRMDPDEWSKTIDTNLTGTFNCTRNVVPSMVRGSGGAIVNVSSVAASSSWPGQSNYVASKAGIDGFTRATARELASLDIRVNAVSPGIVDTGSYEALVDDAVDVADSNEIPQGRIAAPEEVAEPIVFLASDRASYTTGELLRVDGGLLA
jgi:3-oxoacyl-[acyl-carrier protein] reductase